MNRIRPAIILLLVLAAISLYTFYTVLFSSVYIEGNSLYGGFAMLLIAFGLFLIKSRYFKHSVLALLLLWLVGATNYLPVKLALTLGFGEAGLSVQIGALLFILAYYLLYRVRVNNWLLSLIAVDPSSEKAQRVRRQEINKFKSTFKTYTVEKLETIVAEKKLVGYAVVAAKELLSERVSKKVAE
jgi:hypothetical protein